MPDKYPMVLVVNGETGQEGYVSACVNSATCASQPFLVDLELTPSARVDGKRRPLCRACAERLCARLEDEGKPVPVIDWQHAYPTWYELLGDEPR